MQLAGQNLHKEHAQCDMRGDTNIKGIDSSDPSVYFLFCDRNITNFWIPIARKPSNLILVETLLPPAGWGGGVRHHVFSNEK